MVKNPLNNDVCYGLGLNLYNLHRMCHGDKQGQGICQPLKRVSVLIKIINEISRLETIKSVTSNSRKGMLLLLQRY